MNRVKTITLAPPPLSYILSLATIQHGEVQWLDFLSKLSRLQSYLEVSEDRFWAKIDIKKRKYYYLFFIKSKHRTSSSERESGIDVIRTCIHCVLQYYDLFAVYCYELPLVGRVERQSGE